MNFEEAKKIYPRLSSVIKIYFGQDYDLFGDSLEKLMNCAVDDSSPEEIRQLRDDIVHFFENHKDDLDAVFDKAYEFDFDPKLWDTTTNSFLRQLDHLASAKQARHGKL